MIAKVIYPFTQKDQEEQKQSVFSADKFSDLVEIIPKVQNALKDAGYDSMTKIQKEGIPEILKGSNIALKSETGSGKTLAYLVPLISNLVKAGNEEKVMNRIG